MNPKYEDYLSCCLYFTANELARKMTKIADEEFMITKLAPSYAILVMLVNENDGISQGDISKIMALSPSTITRFVDKLVTKDLIYREVSGKSTILHSTDKGKKLQPLIHQAWTNVYLNYCDLIGEDRAVELTKEIGAVNKLLKG